MKKHIFTLLDTVSNKMGNIFITDTVGEAERQFKDAQKYSEDGSVLRTHPDDFALIKIGELAQSDHPVTGLKHYQRLTPDGEIVDLVPEYVSMSRGSSKIKTGGIGKGWLDEYHKEVLDNDSVLFKELKIKPPRYYDDKLMEINPQYLEENKFLRVDKAENSPDNTPERLVVREMIAKQKTEKLYRKEI